MVSMVNDKIKKQAESYLSKLFTGRISRANYLVGYLIVAFGSPIAIMLTVFPLEVLGMNMLSAIPALMIWTVSAVYGISFAVRRFHDMGRGGAELLWFLVPFANIYFLFLIFFKAGDEGENEFGSVPKKEVDLRDLFKVNG